MKKSNDPTIIPHENFSPTYHESGSTVIKKYGPTQNIVVKWKHSVLSVENLFDAYIF